MGWVVQECLSFHRVTRRSGLTLDKGCRWIAPAARDEGAIGCEIGHSRTAKKHQQWFR